MIRLPLSNSFTASSWHWTIFLGPNYGVSQNKHNRIQKVFVVCKVFCSEFPSLHKTCSNTITLLSLSKHEIWNFDALSGTSMSIRFPNLHESQTESLSAVMRKPASEHNGPLVQWNKGGSSPSLPPPLHFRTFRWRRTVGSRRVESGTPGSTVG